MRSAVKFSIFTLCVILATGMSGCATMKEGFREIIGTSTKELYAGRKDAIVKVFDRDYQSCYAKAEIVLKGMAKVSVYDKNKEMIALFYADPNTTPVGIFFTQTGPARTQVEISSHSPSAKERLAAGMFAGLVEPEKSPAKEN